jgi:hypothetical protein
MRKASLVVCGWLVVGALAGAGCSIDLDAEGYTARDEKTFKVEGRPELNLSTFDGAIEVQAWDRPDVQVIIERRAGNKEEADKIEVRADQTGNRVTVEAKQPPRSQPVVRVGWHLSKSVKLIASVPRQTDLIARSADGAITVRRIEGRVELRTSDGSIDATGISGPLLAHTSDGAMELRDIAGNVEAESGDGAITVVGKIEALRARTSDGHITVRADSGSRMTDDWEISTGDGGVDVDLPADFAAELDVHTSDGTVQADNLNIVTSGPLSKDSLRGTLGSGGRNFRIRTSDGSVRLRRG